MAVNYMEDEPSPSQINPTNDRFTVAALFEDRIDAKQALMNLLRTNAPASAISIVFRDSGDGNGRTSRQVSEVAQAVGEAELDEIGAALVGLVSLIVPGGGRYLVAGPIGAITASLSIDDKGPSSAGQSTDATRSSAFRAVLTTFGFGPDESAYIESRLIVGAEFMALTTDNPELVPVVRRLFASDNAVFVSATRTEQGITREAERLLESPPEVYEDSDVVVTDAVARLQPLLSNGGNEQWANGLAGVPVVDPDGNEAGTIEDFLVEMNGAGRHARERLRYIVIAFGGLLGIGRRYTIVPADQVVLESTPVAVMIEKDVLQRAPAYDASAPLSRREERAVCAYYGLSPYWMANEEE